MKTYRLYNVLFPLWMLIIFPSVWLVVVPANFIIDSAVLLIAAHFFCRGMEKEIWKKSIVKVFLFGFLSDFVGSAFLLGGTMIGGYSGIAFIEDLFIDTQNGPGSIGGFFILLFAVALAGICIYFFDYKIAFKKLEIEDAEKKKLALALAIATAPYTFFIPLY